MNKQNSQADGEHSATEEEIIEKPETPAIEENDDDDEDMSEYGVPAMPTEEETESEEKSESEEEEENQEKEIENNEVEIPRITPPEPKSTGLDKRIADVYIQNCLMLGEKNIPTKEEILADLKKYGKDEKIASLNSHLADRKRLRGERPAENNFEDEDDVVIREAERDSIRQEILAEQNEIQVMTHFSKFIGTHPELDEAKKEFKPVIAKAVETLWRSGMPIEEAFDTVTELSSGAKEDEGKEAAIKKQKLLSGSVSASNDFSKGAKNMTWTEFDKLRTSDPSRYEKLLDEGYEPSEE